MNTLKTSPLEGITVLDLGQYGWWLTKGGGARRANGERLDGLEGVAPPPDERS